MPGFRGIIPDASLVVTVAAVVAVVVAAVVAVVAAVVVVAVAVVAVVGAVTVVAVVSFRFVTPFMRALGTRLLWYTSVLYDTWCCCYFGW